MNNFSNNFNSLKALCLSIVFILKICSTYATITTHSTLSEWKHQTFMNFKESPDSRDVRSDKIGFTAQVLEELITQYQTWFKTTDAKNYLGSYAQKLEVPLNSEIILIGDLQGSYHSLMRNLLRLQALGYIDNNWKLKADTYLIFLGDLVQGGKHDGEVLYTVLRLKLANADNVFCIKGNMDGSQHFYFSTNPNIGNFFATFPHALFIKSENSTILCSHAGFNLNENFKNFINGGNPYEKIINKKGSQSNANSFESCGFTGRTKGTSYFLTQEQATDYFAVNKIKALFRGHQDSSFGLKVFFNQNSDNTHPTAINFIAQESNSGVQKASSYHNGQGPYHWSTVINFYNQSGNSLNDNLGIILEKCEYPVFTLSSAPEGRQIDFDCFCIVKTAQEYKNWRLIPYEFQLPGTRNNKFVSIKKSGNPTETISNMNTGIEDIDVDPISVQWTSVTISELENKLMLLNESLKNLKLKLTQLKDRLSDLKKSL